MLDFAEVLAHANDQLIEGIYYRVLATLLFPMEAESIWYLTGLWKTFSFTWQYPLSMLILKSGILPVSKPFIRFFSFSQLWSWKDLIGHVGSPSILVEVTVLEDLSICSLAVQFHSWWQNNADTQNFLCCKSAFVHFFSNLRRKIKVA